MNQPRARARRVVSLDELGGNVKEPLLGRVWFYGRASTSKQIASPDTQKGIGIEYAARLGRPIDGFYIDPAVSGKKPINEREAGKELMAEARPGDIVIVARLDRLARSFINFVQILESFERRGVFLHICDIPGGVFDPSNPMGKLLIHILGAFAEYERQLISTRTKEGLFAVKASGKRHTRHAPYGMKWEHRTDPRTGEKFQVAVACEKSREALFKAVEMRSQGYSLHQIREHLSYKMRVTRRRRSNNAKDGTDQGLQVRDVRNMIVAGMRLLTEQANGEAYAENVTQLEKGRVTNLEP
jgi:putative DNA-invertase from lambdoid prophage Rac